MARPYKAIRDLMRDHDLTNELLGEMLGGLAASTISNKLNGHFPWRSDEMWKIMDLFQIPPHKFHETFPPNGKNKEVVKPLKRPA